VATIGDILRHAQWLECLEPGFLALVILMETGEDYRDRDILTQAVKLIEIFGIDGAAQIVGCP
jgi:hypothetical protein